MQRNTFRALNQDVVPIVLGGDTWQNSAPESRDQVGRLYIDMSPCGIFDSY